MTKFYFWSLPLHADSFFQKLAVHGKFIYHFFDQRGHKNCIQSFGLQSEKHFTFSKSL